MLGVAVCVGLGWWSTAPARRDRAVARDFVRGLREAQGCSSAYANPDRLPWRAWANERPTAVVELFRQLRRELRGDSELRICVEDLNLLMGLAFGVDHHGSRSRALLAEFVVPALEEWRELPEFVGWMLRSPRLRVDPTMVPRLFDLELRRYEDGRSIVIFHERSKPTEFPNLERWARALVAHGAANQARRFVPRLLTLFRKYGTPAAGTLNSLAPLLTPAEASATLATALPKHQGFGLYGHWALGGLVQRLTSPQAEALVPVALAAIERQSRADLHGLDTVSRLPEWGDVLAGLLDKLEPAPRRQVGQAALRLLAQEEDGARLSMLTLSLLRVLGTVEREQVAPVLRPWLERLPSLVAQSELAQSAFIAVTTRSMAWMDRVDPADRSRAARGLRDVLLADDEDVGRPAIGWYVTEAFAAWAPGLASEDAFDIAVSFAQAMTRSRSTRKVGRLSVAIEKFAPVLSRTQTLAIAQILAPRWQELKSSAGPLKTYDDPRLCARLAVSLTALAQGWDEGDRRAFVAQWGPEVVGVGARPPASEQEIRSQQEAQHDQESVREIVKGVLPSDPSAYVQALFPLWLQSWNPVRRSLLIRDMARAATRDPKSLILPAYPRPIPAAQFFVDLLKDHLVDPDDWQFLVQALNASVQRPPEGSLWDFQAWTQQDPAGRALAIDWVRRPPWR